MEIEKVIGKKIIKKNGVAVQIIRLNDFISNFIFVLSYGKSLFWGDSSSLKKKKKNN